MKRKLLSAAILVAAMTVNAQWQINGDSIYYNDGNVGIGTSSPDAMLDVAGFKFGGVPKYSDGRNDIFVVGGSASQIPKSDFVHGSTWSKDGAYWASPMIYRSMRYPNNGTGEFPFNQYGELMIQGTSHGSNYFGKYNMGISFITWDGIEENDPTIRMRIKENGNVGIGTSTPDSKLSVVDNLSSLSFREKFENAQLVVGNNTTEGYAGLFLDASDGDAVGSDYFGIYQDKDLNLNLESMYYAGDIVFLTKPALGQSPDKESMRVTKSGNVGIGTSEPTAKLQVADGDIFISDIDKGIIMKSPDGTCWRGTLDNSGQLNFVIAECPDAPVTSSIEAPLKSETTASNISIYPNPATESVFIESLNFDMSENNKYEVYSMIGQLVKTKKISGRFTKVDISDLTIGTYIFKVSNSNGELISVEEVIKK